MLWWLIPTIYLSISALIYVADGIWDFSEDSTHEHKFVWFVTFGWPLIILFFGIALPLLWLSDLRKKFINIRKKRKLRNEEIKTRVAQQRQQIKDKQEYVGWRSIYDEAEREYNEEMQRLRKP